MSDFKSIGPEGETLAAEYLKGCGYTIIETNYKNNIGEIDIIAREGDDYCFVEVKTRADDDQGGPLEAVTSEKQYRLHKIALGYIQENDLFDEYARFDVVGVTFVDGETDFTLIKNAFDVSSL